MSIIGTYAVPVIFALVGGVILFSKNDLFAEFLKGCKEGFTTTIKLLPTFIALICATRMFFSSGGMDILCGFLGNFTHFLGIPDSVIPIIFMRGVSGSATNALLNELFISEGADSFAGRCACIFMGSTDTIIYTFSVYFGVCKIKNTRFAFLCAFVILLFCSVLSSIITSVFF